MTGTECVQYKLFLLTVTNLSLPVIVCAQGMGSGFQTSETHSESKAMTPGMHSLLLLFLMTWLV